MNKLLMRLIFRKQIAVYSIFTFALFLLQGPAIVLSENISQSEIVSSISKSAKTLVKMIPPTPIPTIAPTPTPTDVPSPTKLPIPTVTLIPISSIEEAVGGEGDAVWEMLAMCESKGNWSTNSGNGYFGGLQFSQEAWNSVGGQGLPSESSKEEQILRGKMLQEKRGWGVWGICAKQLRLN